MAAIGRNGCGAHRSRQAQAAALPAQAGLTSSEHAALLRLHESIRDVLAARTAGRTPEPLPA